MKEMMAERDDDMELPVEHRKYIQGWQSKIMDAKKLHEPAFKQMMEDQKLARFGSEGNYASNQNLYIANITQRFVDARTASLYAKNPRFVAKRREKLPYAYWDGKIEQIMQAVQALQMAGLENPASLAPATLLADYAEGSLTQEMAKRMGKTLEILFKYEIDEQRHSFKQQMKSAVRRAVTTGVGYVKLGYQREMDLRPEIKTQIADHTDRLAIIQQKLLDAADEEIDLLDAERAELENAIRSMESQDQIVLREGLVFDFPSSTSIIPDPACTSVQGWINANWLAQQFHFTRDEVLQIYGVDVKEKYNAYTENKNGGYRSAGRKQSSGPRDELVCVWEVYDKTTNTQFTIADGYPEYLAEPENPNVEVDQFFPIYTLAFHTLEVDEQSESLWPRSDVSLIRHAQLEYNRARQGLREHRIASRPKTVSPAGMLTDEDKNKLKNGVAFQHLELQSLEEGRSVDQVIQPMALPQINPILYETSSTFDDIQRIAGAQEANFGGTAGASATESSIAESSRMSAMQSQVDELDTLLSQIGRDAGKVLLVEMPADRVKAIVGNGAVWPELNRQEIANEMFLEVRAGSSGRPNKAQELANLERVIPFLIQMPGISPSWLVEQVLTRLDDGLDVNEAIAEAVPSIVAMNAMKQPGTGDPATDPNAQGPAGARPGAGAPGRPPMDPNLNKVTDGGAAQAAVSG